MEGSISPHKGESIEIRKTSIIVGKIEVSPNKGEGIEMKEKEP